MNETSQGDYWDCWQRETHCCPNHQQLTVVVQEINSINLIWSQCICTIATVQQIVKIKTQNRSLHVKWFLDGMQSLSQRRVRAIRSASLLTLEVIISIIIMLLIDFLLYGNPSIHRIGWWWHGVHSEMHKQRLFFLFIHTLPLPACPSTSLQPAKVHRVTHGPNVIAQIQRKGARPWVKGIFQFVGTTCWLPAWAAPENGGQKRAEVVVLITTE